MAADQLTVDVYSNVESPSPSARSRAIKHFSSESVVMSLIPPVERQRASDATSIMPLAPPPSLVSSHSTSSTRRPSYSRSDLISLAQTPQLPSGAEDRLAKFSPILRNGSLSSHWGEDESLSSLLDDKPIAALMPIPPGAPVSSTASSSPISSAGGGTGKVAPSSEVLFEFLPSASADAPPPIRMVFHDPFSSSASPSSAASSSDEGVPRRIPAAQALGVSRASIASTASSDYPSEIASFGTSTIGMGTITPSSLGREFDSLRLARAASRSSSVSSGSADDANWRRPPAAMAKDRKQTLNRFAPPWPLPNTTPIIRANSASPTPPPAPAPNMLGGAALGAGELASLPLPKHASLPAKPGPIAPVFVRRESAALAQPMSLPHVQPMGRGWEGDSSMSGNERRRRASQVQDDGLIGKEGMRPGLPIRQGSSSEVSSNASASSDADIIAAAAAGPRPERLVRLGQGLRANANTKVKA